ncbi:MAG: DUF4422 domain-containing protein [Treponema sp.]|jgi:hypothetical protein|nr:DUF4422 domain-containing protein [Treponema sp.]
MPEQPNIKIFVVYHKPYQLLKSNILTPLHAGRAVSLEAAKDGTMSNADLCWIQDRMDGDDTGVNISSRNRNYCELTGIYWVWKNYDRIGDPNYIGFMQYRRHFIFNEDVYTSYVQNENEKAYRIYTVGQIFNGYQDYFGITDDIIRETCEKHDAILPEPVNLAITGALSVRNDYISRIEGTKAKDFDLMMKTVKKYAPEYYDMLERRAAANTKYMYQSFIMKREIFMHYCTFLFGILEKLDLKINTEDYSINGKRTLGYLGETLFDCYIRKHIADDRLRYKELGMTYICTETLPRPIKPKTAIILLAYADFESLEISLAIYGKYLTGDTKLFVLQNGRGSYDCERTYRVARRYASLYPRNIEVVDFIPPQQPYFAIKDLLNNDRLKDYDYICKVDDDTFPLTADWFEKLCDCYEKEYAKHGDNLSYVTVLVNNNPFGFSQLVGHTPSLGKEYFEKIAIEHQAGADIPYPFHPYKILPKTEIAPYAWGTIWRYAFIARWVHEKTTLDPDSYIRITKDLPDVPVDAADRYSINCMLFKKSFWNDIQEVVFPYREDEALCHAYCHKYDKKIIARLSVPFVHLFFYPQREENRDLLPRIRNLYQDWLKIPYPISMCPLKEYENENRMRFMEVKFNTVVGRKGIGIKNSFHDITYCMARAVWNLLRRIYRKLGF